MIHWNTQAKKLPIKVTLKYKSDKHAKSSYNNTATTNNDWNQRHARRKGKTKTILWTQSCFLWIFFWRRNIVCFLVSVTISTKLRGPFCTAAECTQTLSSAVVPCDPEAPRNFLACPLCPCRHHQPRQLRACLLEQLPVEPVCTPSTASLHTQLVKCAHGIGA